MFTLRRTKIAENLPQPYGCSSQLHQAGGRTYLYGEVDLISAISTSTELAAKPWSQCA